MTMLTSLLIASLILMVMILIEIKVVWPSLTVYICYYLVGLGICYFKSMYCISINLDHKMFVAKPVKDGWKSPLIWGGF